MSLDPTLLLKLLLKLLLGCSVLRRATTFLVVAGEWVTFGKTPSMGGLVSVPGALCQSCLGQLKDEIGGCQSQCGQMNSGKRDSRQGAWAG